MYTDIVSSAKGMGKNKATDTHHAPYWAFGIAIECVRYTIPDRTVNEQKTTITTDIQNQNRDISFEWDAKWNKIK